MGMLLSIRRGTIKVHGDLFEMYSKWAEMAEKISFDLRLV